MKENPSSWTSIPSGTMTWTPPQKATAVITTSGPSISAWRRSISHPPMTATAVVRAPTRQRPLAREPLMTATNDRRAGRRVETSWGTATSGRSAMAACKSPWVRAWRARPTRWVNSSRVSRPSTACSRSWVTARSRSASATRTSMSPVSPRRGAGARGSGSDESGRSVTTAVCSLTPLAACFVKGPRVRRRGLRLRAGCGAGWPTRCPEARTSTPGRRRGRPLRGR